MEFLENLNSFHKGISNFGQGNMYSVIYSPPPDISNQLSKTKCRLIYKGFFLNSASSRINIEFLSEICPKGKVEEIRISTYPGCIRLSNDKYIQNQLVTQKIFGFNVDILPTKFNNLIKKYQLIILTKSKMSRYGIAPFTPEFLTTDMNEKIYEYNRKRRESISSFFSPSTSNINNSDSI